MPFITKTSLCSYLLSLIVMGLASSCIFSGGRSGESVLERSKQETPAWAELAPGELHADGKGYQYVEVGKDLLDLPLGIKQTQLAAIQSSRMQVVSGLQKQLKSLADKHKIKLDASKSAAETELQRLVEKTVDAHSARLLRTTDIFFERLEGTQADKRGVYRVYVLVNLPADAVAELAPLLSQQLKQAQSPALRRLPQLLSVSSPLSFDN